MISFLPTKKSIPRQHLSQYFILIFGESGIGKTEFAASFPNALFALFEDGTKGLSVYGVDLYEQARNMGRIKSGCQKGIREAIPWDAFKKVKDEFLTGNHDFKTMVIDTEDIAYRQALDYVCLEGDYKHPSEKGYGAGWNELNTEFEGVHNELIMSQYGLVAVSHANFKEISDIRGNKRDKLVPSVGGAAGSWLVNTADIIIFYDKDEDGNRVLRLEGDKNFDAKQRLRFENPAIPAGSSGKEAFENFKKEFDKAIAARNEELGITQEMIDEYYMDETLEPYKDKIKSIAKAKGLNSTINSELMQEQIGCTLLSEISSVGQAEKYIDFLENKYEG